MRSFVPLAAAISTTLFLTNTAFAGDPIPPPAPTLEQADAYFARADFDKAAIAYAAFTDKFSQDPRASHAFAQAAMLEMRLGHHHEFDIALRLREFENKFGAAHVDEWSEIAFTMADGFANRQDRANALVVLNRILTVQSKWLAEAERKKGADVQRLREIELRARGRLAHLYTDAGDYLGADAEYLRVQNLVPKLGVWPGKKPARATAKYPETMDFIAESYFYAAEQKRFEADRMTLPAYLGKGERDSVMAFVNGPGEQWHKQRRYLVEEANRLYAFVLGLELPKPEPPKPPPPPLPAGMIGLLGGDPNAPQAPIIGDPASLENTHLTPPSPQWAIAAAERAGKLWSSFRQELIRMPIPAEWKGSGLVPGTDLTYEELKGEFICGIVDSPSETLKQQAGTAYRYCLNLSIQHRIVNEHTQACIHWLSRNYGWEYHEIDDFAPPGEFVALGQYTRPVPLSKVTH